MAPSRLEISFDPGGGRPSVSSPFLGSNVHVCSGSGRAMLPRSCPAAPVSHPTPLDAARIEMDTCTTAPTYAPLHHQARPPDHLWRMVARSTHTSHLRSAGIRVKEMT